MTPVITRGNAEARHDNSRSTAPQCLHRGDAPVTAQAESVRIGGVAIHYLRWGEGSPSLLLLHGASHCAGIWSPLAERLAADGYTVVAADLRGHGASDKPEAGYGWQQMRDDMIGLIESLNLSELVLAGHSRGGGVSLLTAAAVPDRVRGVFVYEPTMPLPSAPDRAPSGRRISQMAERALARRSVFPGRKELLAHLRTRDAFRNWDERYIRAYVDYGTVDREDGAIELCCPPRVEALLYEALADPGPWSELSGPDVSVVAMFGANGGRVREGEDPAAGLRRMFPRCESTIMPGATHFGPMEHPEAFYQALRGFMDGDVSGGGSV